jgi:hypothetical protein
MLKKIITTQELALAIMSLHPSHNKSAILNAMLKYAYDDGGGTISHLTGGKLELGDKYGTNRAYFYADITEPRYIHDCGMFGNASNKVYLGRFIKAFFEFYPEVNKLDIIVEHTEFKPDLLCINCKKPRGHNVKGVMLCSECLQKEMKGDTE